MIDRSELGRIAEIPPDELTESQVALLGALNGKDELNFVIQRALSQEPPNRDTADFVLGIAFTKIALGEITGLEGVSQEAGSEDLSEPYVRSERSRVPGLMRSAERVALCTVTGAVLGEKTLGGPMSTLVGALGGLGVGLGVELKIHSNTAHAMPASLSQ